MFKAIKQAAAEVKEATKDVSQEEFEKGVQQLPLVDRTIVKVLKKIGG